ncbi:hypothetical protein RFI_19450, partial [Reticulomyxa filosa]
MVTDKNEKPKRPLLGYQIKSPIEMAAILFEACAKGDLKTVRTILSLNKEVVKYAVDPHTDATALMTACYHGFYQIAHELVMTKQVNINETNYFGLSALHFAAQAGFENIVELLIHHGIHINAQAEDGVTALFVAVEKAHEFVIEKLLNNDADVNLCW